MLTLNPLSISSSQRKSFLNILTSEKILSQYPHVRDCPSLPPLIQRNKIRPAFYFFTPGKVLIYLVHFHRESFLIYEILSPLFALDLPQPQTKLKLSSSTKVTSQRKAERGRWSSRFFLFRRVWKQRWNKLKPDWKRTRLLSKLRKEKPRYKHEMYLFHANMCIL